MSPAQVAYPFLALAEVGILVRTRVSRAQNAPALRLWLVVQLACFCFLEPASFLSIEIWGAAYFGTTILSAAADLMVLYSVWYCLEGGFPAFGSIRAWTATAILSGMLFCFASELPLPPKASGISIAWLTADQAYTYIRALVLIALSFYGYLRAASWPRDLAWTWIAMATFGLTDTLVTRIRILESNSELFEIVMAIAAMLQLGGWWRALSYAPKPLTSLELETARNLSIPNP